MLSVWPNLTICRRTADADRAARRVVPGDQREAIEALVDKRERVLVVQRTGWGKSALYFLTALRSTCARPASRSA